MNRIREYREKFEYKQSQLASMLNVATSSLSGWENEKYSPDYGTLRKMASIFNTTIDDIMGESPESNEQQDKQESPRQIPIRETYKQANLSDEAIQLAQKYMLLNPSAQAVLRGFAEYELRQDTYMRTEIEGLKIEYEKQIRDLKMQIPEEAEA